MTKKRKPTRKRLELIVLVTVPYGMSAAQARREVKTLITHQRNYSADEGDVKAIAVNPVPLAWREKQLALPFQTPEVARWQQ
jgi:hypothetical protein